MKEMHECPRHGLVIHHRIVEKRAKDGYRWRCKVCMAEYVVRRKRKVKAILIAEAGGCCRICGYDRCVRALHFHHVDPTTKMRRMDMGLTKSLDNFRKEAAKCVLLCSNCHMEVEENLISCPALLGVL